MYRYQLAQSNEGSIEKDYQDISLNLTLEENEYFNNALISGFVLQSNGKPVEKALVSFIDEDNHILGCVYSNEKGFYTFIGVKLNSRIMIIVEKSEYRKFISRWMKVVCENYNINISLTKKCNCNTSIISGHITNNGSEPVGNIFVYMIFFDSKKRKLFINTTATNQWGQFVFYKVIKGDKIILINDARFNQYNKLINIAVQEEIYNLNIKLMRKTNNTIIEGCIKNTNGIAVPFAHVVLFRKNKNGKLKAVACTRCNNNGKYKFKDLSKGNYVVKALK
ncbi:carboxypeptidase-like regulatory domain-containing protein [Clostridium grantii]|uniref:Carboxypeptidase regulatory-like domain-containing protein n=1 Tax=Clostridium grantii DSM 8605 TaxID=1121316 RepID=A0A1M5VUP7_9CLOT|nr:carboxypeptidase-like regulatory domain-containing protein [Clostridium grantii]SHH78951.1 hypothetical protein SAMN02745207_02507 [Clostridium grantii DSM 8605]